MTIFRGSDRNRMWEVITLFPAKLERSSRKFVLLAMALRKQGILKSFMQQFAAGRTLSLSLSLSLSLTFVISHRSSRFICLHLFAANLFGSEWNVSKKFERAIFWKILNHCFSAARRERKLDRCVEHLPACSLVTKRSRLLRSSIALVNHCVGVENYQEAWQRMFCVTPGKENFWEWIIQMNHFFSTDRQVSSLSASRYLPLSLTLSLIFFSLVRLNRPGNHNFRLKWLMEQF